MYDAIKQFHTQFSFRPEVVNGEHLPTLEHFVVGGMGGSGHAADILRIGRPEVDMVVHRNYGIPHSIDKEAKECLFIASSYSGNTEEVLDFFNTAYTHMFPAVAYTKGGKLLEIARREKLPHVVLPDTDIQPRSALGVSLMALTKIIGDAKTYTELQKLEKILNPEQYMKQGESLATTLFKFVPIIYTSSRNWAIANNWKIKCNETGKMPAYYAVFPELNHNEIEGYSNAHTGKTPTQQFHFIFITDEEDHPRIQKRMNITQKLYEEQGLQTTILPLEGESRFERIFNSLLLADWTAFYSAEKYGLNSEEVPMVEDLKKMLR